MADIDFDTVTDLGGIENNTIALECPYKDKCTDAGVKCATCVHNPKRSYYRPAKPTIPEYYIPVYYPEPYYIYPYYYPERWLNGVYRKDPTEVRPFAALGSI